MDRINDLARIVELQMAEYHTVKVLKGRSYYLTDPEQKIYTVIDVPDSDHPSVKKAGVVVMARIVDDQVVIDEDTTDRPLFEELMRQGIAREQIVLAYAGETLPDKDNA